MKRNLLSNVDVVAVSLVNKGANRKTFFLRKAADEEKAELLTLPTDTHQLLKKQDWSAVYCVVAEPDALEDSGIGGTEVPDMWASEDEIRKACHRFAKNGALINKMHETLDPFGVMVENAIAPVDFEVEGHTIRKGSWYIAIEPNDHGRDAIEKGEFTGVSIEGTGIRTTIEKGGDESDVDMLDALMVSQEGEIAKTAGPSLDRKPGVSNWVDEVGGLPDLIDRAARHLHYEKGRTISAAIATAVNWAKKMCSTGTAFGGKVKVSAGAQSRACAAVSEWEAKKKAAGVKKAKGHNPETEDEVLKVLGSTADERTVENVETTETGPKAILAKISDLLRANDPEPVTKTELEEVSPEGSTTETRTTDGEMETEEVTQKIDGLEAKVDTLAKSVETLVTNLGAKSEDGEVTPESVAKAVEGLAGLEGEELNKRFESIESDLKKLGAGSSAQNDEDPEVEDLSKAAITKAFTDQGVSPALAELI